MSAPLPKSGAFFFALRVLPPNFITRFRSRHAGLQFNVSNQAAERE